MGVSQATALVHVPPVEAATVLVVGHLARGRGGLQLLWRGSHPNGTHVDYGRPGIGYTVAASHALQVFHIDGASGEIQRRRKLTSARVRRCKILVLCAVLPESYPTPN